jgi:hypothetical protein
LSSSRGAEYRSDVDLGMRFEDLDFSQGLEAGGSPLLGVGAFGSVYRAMLKVRASIHIIFVQYDLS